MFFNSIKEINMLREDINTLVGKGIWNIYLKVIIEEKNWPSQSFDFLGLKNFLPQIKNQRSYSKTVCNFSINFILKCIMTF